MPDIIAATVLTLLTASSTSLKNVIDIAQKVREWGKSKDDPEAQQVASDFLSALLDLQGDVVHLQHECARLVEENRVAKNHLEYRAKLIRRNSYYEFAEPVEGYGQGPFCLNCTDLNGFPVGVPVDASGHFTCSKCGSMGWLAGKEEDRIARNKAANEANRKRLQERGLSF